MSSSKRKPRKHATRHSEPSRVPAWVWLFTGAVLGAFVMFLMRLSDIQTDPAGHAEPKLVEQKQRPVEQKPRFDFYDLLKDTHVPISQNTSVEKQPATTTATPIRQEFLLQVASFQSLEDADRLRAKLILLNLEAQTEQAKIRNGETWHRVIVGPFTSKSKLAKARSILLANRYEALVLQRQPQG